MDQSPLAVIAPLSLMALYAVATARQGGLSFFLTPAK